MPLVTVHRIPARTAALIVALTILNLLASQVGAGQPPHPALEGFRQGCETQPCWYGIIPGETRLEEARALLQHFGWDVIRRDMLDYVRLEGSSPSGCTLLVGGSVGLARNPRLDSLPITVCNDLRLGDVMAELGTPNRVSTCDTVRHPVPQFHDRISVVLENPKDSRQWMSPFDRVDRLLLIGQTPFPMKLRWHGFAPAWRYEALGQDEGCG